MPFSLSQFNWEVFLFAMDILRVPFTILYKNRSLYHVFEENSALFSVGCLPLIESSCPQYQRYLHLGVSVSVYTNTYEDLKKGLGARTCLLSFLFALLAT